MDAFYLSDLQIFHLGALPHLFAFSVIIIFTPDSTGKTLLGTIATSTFFSMEYTTLCIEVTESYHGGKFRDHRVQSPYSRDEETTPRNEGRDLPKILQRISGRAGSRIWTPDSQGLFTSPSLSKDITSVCIRHYA